MNNNRCRNTAKGTTWRAPDEDSNQPAHPRSLIRVFVFRIRKLFILGYSKSVRWRFLSDHANAQACLNLRWVRISEGMFSDIATHMNINLNTCNCYFQGPWHILMGGNSDRLIFLPFRKRVHLKSKEFTSLLVNSFILEKNIFQRGLVCREDAKVISHVKMVERSNILH